MVLVEAFESVVEVDWGWEVLAQSESDCATGSNCGAGIRVLDINFRIIGCGQNQS